MTTYVSIDGGKSGLRALAAGPDGRRTGDGPGFTYGGDDVTTILDAVRGAVRTLELPPQVDGVCAGLTGVPADPALRRQVREGLEAMLGGPAVLVEDVVTAHAGALGAPGVVTCAGTGVTVLAVSASGRTGRIDGWGPVLGDRGSAHAIGQHGLRAAASALDGSGPPTALTEALADTLGGLDLHTVQEFYRAGSLVARTAAFAVAVVAAADAGDEVAGTICAGAADDLVRSVVAAGARAGLTDDAHVVSHSGRLFGSGDALLQCFTTGLDAHGWRLVPPRGDALEGGLALLTDRRSLYETTLASWKDTPEC